MTHGIEQLGYIGFGVRDLDAWEAFMTKVLGLGLARKSDDGAMAFRMDGHAQRFLICPDTADDLIFVGWQVADKPALEAIAGRVREAGVEVVPGTADERADRQVTDLIKFVDPGGIPVEIFYGPAMGNEPFKSDYVGSQFVADDMGLGHLVVSTKSRDESRDFYINVLGFKLSDYIICDIGTYHVDIVFLHTNPRHHSLAMGGPMPTRMHHFMLQVASLDDVGLAYDRARDHGVII